MNVLGIYGASGLGREVLELAKEINNTSARWDRIVFIDDAETLDKTIINGSEVYSFPRFKENFDSENPEITIGLGEPALRKSIYTFVKNAGYPLATLIHPTVHIPDTTILGEGCTVCSRANVSCNITIGNNTFLQPMCSLGHDTVIGNNCVISTFATLAGHVTVGNETYIAMYVPVIQGTTIGSESIIGMGSVVLKDIPDNMIALGNPARPMRRNDTKRVFK